MGGYVETAKKAMNKLNQHQGILLGLAFLVLLGIIMLDFHFTLVEAAVTFLYIAGVGLLAEYLEKKKKVSNITMFALVSMAAGVYLLAYYLLSTFGAQVYLPAAWTAWYLLADGITGPAELVRDTHTYVKRYVREEEW